MDRLTIIFSVIDYCRRWAESGYKVGSICASQVWNMRVKKELRLLGQYRFVQRNCFCIDLGDTDSVPPRNGRDRSPARCEHFGAFSLSASLMLRIPPKQGPCCSVQ